MVDALFYESLALLDDSPGVVSAGRELILRAAIAPEKAPELRYTAMRVIYSKQHGEIPALRLFFTIDEGAVVLLTIETYDELL